jgi:hypothetical protein
MNRDDIERMAREAKGHPYTNRYTPGETAFAFSIDRLEHFVSLVTAAEREACAKVADEVGDRDSGFHAYDAADAIRARSNP